MQNDKFVDLESDQEPFIDEEDVEELVLSDVHMLPEFGVTDGAPRVWTFPHPTRSTPTEPLPVSIQFQMGTIISDVGKDRYHLHPR
jgi:hypothetical protein